MTLNPIETLSNSDSNNPFHIVCPILEFVLQKEEAKAGPGGNILAAALEPMPGDQIAGKSGT
ncbi:MULTISPECIES: hypothetical protein [Ensifer]|uniref:hypothetical protein n=1 Tax=Ensifer TaxID=106591 RepID=UPI0007107D71|nr:MULTISPECIES: hypothetical protein [Ensifer]KQW34771.1 hypothetical protein ASD02_16160 [Ensifer sp. Root1252]KQW68305.1 hypothetical protein ASD03_34150 [Ensifer sp. Root127]KRC57097.1 hypothetical protein ASE32_19475 [Ensifer sp. Root231]KRC87592.1 hypothetical protein ASE47_13630 [Ensifer sp. Root258]NOV19892.1 hypothetical protein [Ensifer canadensis]